MHNFLRTLAVILFISSAAGAQCLEGADFETGSEPAGWTRSGSYIGTLTPYEGTYHAGFNTAGDMLTLPAVSCPGEICYYWRSSGFNADFDLLVEWSDDAGATWNTAQTYSFDGSGGASTSYLRECVDLPEASFTDPSNVIIRFNQTRRVASSFYLDSICVKTGVCSVTPTELRFNAAPSGCVNANTNFSLNVCATDAFGNVDATYSDPITVSVYTGPGTLAGTATVSASSGCASFTDLQLDSQGDYTLIASDGALNNDTSSTIRIENSCPTVDTLKVVSYNLLNFPNSRAGCANYIADRVDTLRKIMQYLQPDILMVCELQDETGADLILNNALNVGGVTKYARANFVLNTSSLATDLNNMFFYNSDKVTLYSQGEIQTDLRDVGEYIVYGKDPNLASHNDTTFIDFYETHFKAGSASGDSLRRVEEADSVRQYIDARPVGRFNIIGGDFNLYTDQEQAYQLLTSGTYPFNDPIAREGDWSANGSFADVHTQSTRSGVDYDCGAFGGVDDRFDFLLTSTNILSGTERVSYVSGTYTALGNDGSVFNQDINDAGNTSGIPDSVLSALYYMSDHLPVVMDIEIEYPNSNLPIDTEAVESKMSLVAQPEFTLYPNPATDECTVQLPSVKDHQPSDLVVYNAMGEEVKRYPLSSGETQQTIMTSSLAEGVYFVRLYTAGYPTGTKKLIVK